MTTAAEPYHRSMWRKTFWKQAAERGLKSAAQALLGLWALDGFNVLDVDDVQVPLGVALGALVLSVLTSVVTAGVGQEDSPSAVKVE